MTYKILKLLLLFAVATCTIAKAQHISKKNDTIKMQQILHLKTDLNLTSDQFFLLKIIDSSYKKGIDSLNRLTLNTAQRKQSLQSIVLLYQQALQSCFSKTQWQQYQAKQKAVQQSFEEHAKQQKIKYTLLNNQ